VIYWEWLFGVGLLCLVLGFIVGHQLGKRGF
jgi:hypothetical protein